MAKIFIEMQRYREASTALEQALSLSFEVRESPIYFLLRAQCHEKQGEWKQALTVLQSAMKLPGVAAAAEDRTPAPGARNSAPKGRSKVPTPAERAQIFIHLATVHTHLGQTPEAAKIIQEAKREFYGLPAHSQIIIVDAQLALGRYRLSLYIRRIDLCVCVCVCVCVLKLRMYMMFI
jgi:tetratricopeptide repeat protein 21B